MLKRYVFLLLFLLSTVTTLEAGLEDKIKSIYIGRFSMFFKWPKQSNTFNICIHNDSKFTNFFSRQYRNRLPNETPLNVIAIKTGELLKVRQKCNILYVRNESIRENKFLLDDFNKTNVLLISDEYDDIYHGSIISFYLKENKVRFVINHKKLLASGLEVSYKLLKYAKIVNPVVGNSYAK